MIFFPNWNPAKLIQIPFTTFVVKLKTKLTSSPFVVIVELKVSHFHQKHYYCQIQQQRNLRCKTIATVKRSSNNSDSNSRHTTARRQQQNCSKTTAAAAKLVAANLQHNTKSAGISAASETAAKDAVADPVKAT